MMANFLQAIQEDNAEVTLSQIPLDKVNQPLNQVSQNQQGQTLMHLAAKSNSVSILQSYISTALLNVKDNLGREPIHYAASNGSVEFLEILLQNQVDVNSTTLGQETPLMKAAQFGQKECIEVLLKWGAEVTIANLIGQTAIDIAQSIGRPDLFADLD